MLNWNFAPAYYTVNDADFEQAFNTCINSPYITSNPDYDATAKSIKLAINKDGEDCDSINAAAGTDSEGNKIIIMNIGIMRWLSAMAIICTKLAAGESVSKCKKMLKWCGERITHGKAGSDFIERFVSDFRIQMSGYDLETEHNYALAMTATILGHEIGHLCLHHNGYDKQINSSNRNFERQADMFSASLIQTNGASELTAVAAVMSLLSFKYIHGKHDKMDGQLSHPGTTERINMMIESFRAQLEHSKISPKVLRELGGI